MLRTSGQISRVISLPAPLDVCEKQSVFNEIVLSFKLFPWDIGNFVEALHSSEWRGVSEAERNTEMSLLSHDANG